MGVVAAGLSSLTRRKGLAQAMFAAAVFASGFLSKIVAAATDRPWIRTLGIGGCVDGMVTQWRGDSPLHGAQSAIPAAAFVAWATFGAVLAWWRVSRAEVVRG